jgi:drug/metabolite transporter (DMT)-like permease
MFLGEQMCLYWFYLQRQTTKQPQSNGSPLLFTFPAVLDLIASCFYAIGLAFCSLSVTQIIFSFQIVVTTVLSRFILKKHIAIPQLIGVLFVFVGILLTGISSIYIKSATYTTTVGVVLILLANIIWPIQFIIEEKLFRSYRFNALEAIGYEGLSGSTLYLLILPMLLNVGCSASFLDESKRDGFCIFGKIEDPIFAIDQMLSNRYLIATTVMYIIVISFVNFSMIAVIKYGSAISSVTVSSLRILLLWVVSLVAGWEKFSILELLGFILVLIGSLLYNEIIRIAGQRAEELTVNNE